MYILTTRAEFDSAHFLSGYEGKCSNIHGHRWKVVIEVAADNLEEQGQTRGMLVDFSKLKKGLYAEPIVKTVGSQNSLSLLRR